MLVDELLIQNSDLRARRPVKARNIDSLRNFFWNAHNAILEEEVLYVKHYEDLIQLAYDPWRPLREFVRSLSIRLRFPERRRVTSIAKSEKVRVETYGFGLSERTIDTVVVIISTAMAVALLIVPLWLLAVTHGIKTRLGIITGFVVLFLAISEFTTDTRTLDGLLAAAG